jgi:methyl-accepting chemotaxis protein
VEGVRPDVRVSLGSKVFLGNLLTVLGSAALTLAFIQSGAFADSPEWVLFASVLLPASVAAWIISRRLTRNLVTLSGAARAVSEGDLSRRLDAQTDATWSDEIDYLARSTASMVDELRDIVGHIQRNAARVSEASSGLVDNTRIVGREAESVADRISGVSERAGQQTRKMETQSEIMSRMASELRRSADIAAEAAQSTQETSAAATEGNGATRMALDRIRAVFERVEGASTAVDALSRRTAEIHEIVEAMTQIAQQTHMLSVNASIEAARAGDSARGFAVVAEEIRRLADSSASSADQIRDIVQGIDRRTREVVDAMGDSTKDLRESRREIDGIAGNLDTIVDGTRREAQKVGTLSEVIGGQLLRIEEVAEAASHVREVAGKNAEATRAVELASAEQRRRCHDLERAARQLAEVAHSLDAVAGRFRL